MTNKERYVIMLFAGSEQAGTAIAYTQEQMIQEIKDAIADGFAVYVIKEILQGVQDEK